MSEPSVAQVVEATVVKGGSLARRREVAPLSVIERMAKDPKIDIAKLTALIAMKHAEDQRHAELAFEEAFEAMQDELPVIKKRGKQLHKGGASVRNYYARLGEDILPVVRPILTKHGFSLRHRTEWPADKPGVIRIIGKLKHRMGHCEEDIFEALADGSDYRTDVQSRKSTQSFGRRTTTVNLLNLTEQGVDDDGASGAKPRPAGSLPEPRSQRQGREPGEDDDRDATAQPGVSATVPDGDLPITTGTKEQPFGQIEKLKRAFEKSGRSQTEVQVWLKSYFGYRSSREIQRKHFDFIVAMIERKGALPPAVGKS